MLLEFSSVVCRSTVVLVITVDRRFKGIVAHVALRLVQYICTVLSGFVAFKQGGWEFAHLISERIARFLSKNERISDSLKKNVIHSFAHFW